MLFRQGFDKEKHKQQNKLRRLWRPAVATHPQMQANGIIADWGMLWEAAGRACQNSLILKKSQSPAFHKPGLCYV